LTVIGQFLTHTASFTTASAHYRPRIRLDQSQSIILHTFDCDWQILMFTLW